MDSDKLAPVHPGEILLEEFMKPLGITRTRLAENLGVNQHHIRQIVRSERPVTADTALRLSRCFATSERFWLNLQTQYDLEVAKDLLGDRLDKEVKVLATDKQDDCKVFPHSGICPNPSFPRKRESTVPTPAFAGAGSWSPAISEADGANRATLQSS